MTFLLLVPAILSFLVLAAHFLRASNLLLDAPVLSLCLLLLVAPCLGMCMLLLVRQRWVLRVAQGVLILAGVEWVRTANAVAQDRMVEGGNWLRPALILLAVAGVNVVAAALFQTRLLREYYAHHQK